MSIFLSPAAGETPARRKPLWRALAKQLLMAIVVGGIVLTGYLYIRQDLDNDKTIGKYAFINGRDDYLGVIKWHGRSARKGLIVFQIKQPAGEMIEVDDSYVEVRDHPPKIDD